MRMLIQRVKSASVEVDNQCVSKINQGLLVLLGIHQTDESKDISWLVNKLLNLRVFNDAEDKMNLSVQDVQGEILIVSQFTLYADCKTSRRPDLFHAAKGDKAKPLYEEFVQQVRQSFPSVQTGIFGANMQVQLCNDGPVTLLVERHPEKYIKLNFD